jgi:hypothetical protein
MDETFGWLPWFGITLLILAWMAVAFFYYYRKK